MFLNEWDDRVTHHNFNFYLIALHIPFLDFLIILKILYVYGIDLVLVNLSSANPIVSNYCNYIFIAFDEYA